MGLVSLVIGFAPAVGPTLSGVLVDSIGWRMLFVVITVVGVLLVLSAVKFLENYGDFERTSFDKLSVLLSTVGLVCLLYGLSTFSSTTNPAMTAGFIVVGLVVIAIFVRRQLKLEMCIRDRHSGHGEMPHRTFCGSADPPSYRHRLHRRIGSALASR